MGRSVSPLDSRRTAALLGIRATWKELFACIMYDLRWLYSSSIGRGHGRTDMALEGGKEDVN